MAVELHELVLCALARKSERRTRLRILEAISERLGRLNRQQLRTAARRIQNQRKRLEHDSGCAV